MILNDSGAGKFVAVDIEDGMVTVDFKPKIKRRKPKEEAQTLPEVTSNLPAEKVQTPITNLSTHDLDGEKLKFGKDGSLLFEENLRKCLIADYCEFYIELQRRAAFLVGKIDPHLATPEIVGIDVKFLRLTSAHFARIGCKTKGDVIRLFRTMYAKWELLDQWCQKGLKPQQIYHNINSIVIQLKTNKEQSKEQKRNEQYNNKLAETHTRDYSKLVKGGKTDS